MDKIILTAARIFLSVIISSGVCTALSFFIYLLISATDYKPDRVTFGYILVAGLTGIFIGLIAGIVDLGMIGGGLTGLSAALILWLLDIKFMANGGRYEFSSNISQIDLLVFMPALTLGGSAAAGIQSLIFNFFNKR